jgi:branched-chain amino acid transport system permease protein
VRPLRALGGAAGVVALWAVLAAALPHGAPTGIVIAGVVFGAINGLVALSIVLVYRANRVFNFAAAQFGAVGAIMAIELHIQLGLNYFLCVLAGLVIAGVLAASLELTVLRRFANAPRLIVMVATIGLAQLLDGISVVIPTAWGGIKQPSFGTPFNVHFHVFPEAFDGNWLAAIVVVPVALLALTWFLRYTHYGVAIRAASENGERARLLGIPVARLSTVVWTITGVLSLLAVLLRVPILGFASFSAVSSGGLPLLLQTGAAAVIGGMTNLPVTLMAAIGLGVVDQLAAWTFSNATYVDLTIFLILLVSLLARRDRLTRAAETGITTWQAIKQVRAVPTELAHLREVRVLRQGTRLAVIALAVALPYVVSPSRTQLASDVLVYAMIGCSLVVLTGWAGHISLGQIAFMGFGAATTGILVANHGWDLFPGLLAGATIGAAVATVIGIPALRIAGLYLAIVTLGFAVVSAEYFLVPQNFPWFIPSGVSRPALFGRISISTDRQMYFMCLIVLALILTALSTLRRSHVGRSLLAGKDNRLAAQSMGLETVKLNLVAFGLSGAIAGLAGGMFVVLQSDYNFGSFSADQGLTFFAMVVIGGLGSIPGAVLGSIYVYGCQYLLPGGYSVLATGVGLLLLLMFLPGGLGELMYRIRDALLRLVAARHRVLVPSLVADRADDATMLAEPEAELVPAPLRGPPTAVSPNGGRSRRRAAPPGPADEASEPVSANGRGRTGTAVRGGKR